MKDFVEGSNELSTDALLYFKEDYPLSLNYNNSINGDPFAFPWNNSTLSLFDKFLGSAGEQRNRINGMNQNFFEDSPYSENSYHEKHTAFRQLEREEMLKKYPRKLK